MKVELLWWDGCPSYPETLVDLTTVLREEGVDADVDLVEVENDEQARRERFPGSPTVRIDGVDAVEVLTAARDAAPGDLGAQLIAADVEIGAGQLAAGYNRLLGVIRTTAGADREEARARLVELFLLAPDDSPEALRARRDLAVALY